MSQALPANTQIIYAAPEQFNAKIRIAYVPTGTNVANSYTTVPAGNYYYRTSLNLTGYTLYFQSSKAGIVLEIEAWTSP